MRELLELGQLGFIHRDTLFVHGGLVGGPWQGSGDGITCYGYVPGRADRIMDAREWIAALNEWKRTQLAEWMQQPFWVDPSDVTTNVPTRAASALIDYVCPGCEPSVVMGRQLDKKGMPRPLSADLVATLNGSGIYKLAVGHTPHGNAPTLLQTSGLLMVMADTSYSDMSSPDNRGAAISEVQFLEDGSVRVSGVLQDGRKILFSLPDSTSPWVGHTLPVFPPSSSGQEPSNKSTDDLGFSPKMIETAALDALDGKEYFVKAYLREEELYLLCNVDGFVQSYVTLAALELNALFKKACGGQGRTSGGRNPATDVRGLQASWLTHAEARDAESSKGGVLLTESSLKRLAIDSIREDVGEDDTTEDKRMLRRPSVSPVEESDIQISSLGDVDIVGLVESSDYARASLERLFSSLDADSTPNASISKQLYRQSKRLGHVAAQAIPRDFRAKHASAEAGECRVGSFFTYSCTAQRVRPICAPIVSSTLDSRCLTKHAPK